ETTPVFRSAEPNLAVYRALGVPVFRPRDGLVLLAGRLLDLHARCLTAVCVRRGYVSRGRARLYHYVLREPEAIAVAAAELYAHYTASVGEEEDVVRAVEQFAGFRDGDPDRYWGWLWLTDALLASIPFGLPTAFVAAVLRNDFGLEGVSEAHV